MHIVCLNLDSSALTHPLSSPVSSTDNFLDSFLLRPELAFQQLTTSHVAVLQFRWVLFEHSFARSSAQASRACSSGVSWCCRVIEAPLGKTLSQAPSRCWQVVSLRSEDGGPWLLTGYQLEAALRSQRPPTIPG